MISVSTACTASAHAIGEAFRRIQEGDARLMLAGGYDALTTWLDVMGFALLGALTTELQRRPEQASRPFDRDRSGFVLGEGAVVAVLEDLESARARGARILRRDRRLRLEHERLPDDRRARRTAAARSWRSERALADSGLRRPRRSTTSSRTARARRATTCARRSRSSGSSATTRTRLAISSPKSMTGHLTAAAGALNLLAAVLRDARRRRPADDQPRPPRPEAGPRLRPERGARMPGRAAMRERVRVRRHERLASSCATRRAAGAPRDEPARRTPSTAVDSDRSEVDPDEVGARRSATSRTRSRSSTATSRASRSCRAC